MAANSLTMNTDSKIEDLREDSVGITSSIIKSRNPRKNLKFSEEVVGEGRGGLEVDSSSRGHTLLVHKGERVKCSSNYHRVMCSPVMPEPSAMLNHHAGHKFHEVFQLKQGRYADLPAANISEMMKSNSLDNAPTQSLLSVVNGILDESIDRKNGEIPHRVACLLRKVVQEIERRVSAQAEHIRTQSHMNKSREEKYQSRIRVLEALASGTNEEFQTHKSLMEERKKPQEEELVVKLMNDMENSNRETSTIKKDLLDTARKKSEQKDAVVLMKDNSDTELEISAMKRELETTKNKYEQDLVRLKKEKGNSDIEISELKQELEITKKKHEQRCLHVETQAKETQKELQTRLKEFQLLLEESRKKEKELETFTALKARNWSKKEHTYQSSINFQFQALKELRLACQYIKKEVINTQNNYLEEFNCLGEKFQEFAEAAQNYNMVLAENRRLHNEVQDLKGSIRVYCRIRPSPAGQSGKTSSIDYIGENGELTIVNPTKQGKDGHRVFKFNKVFGPLSTQAEVYLDTQPLIRSVLDGYNVCIFAYGQTGSGKTYTMSGPNLATKEEWGVNYRALNDLFDISWKRRSTISYEIGVQMVEIYNEQVRDLLSEGSQKKLEIRFTSQQNGLAVPGASMHPVRSTEHVLELMQIGLGNRAVSATAMNERSSRSHSVVTVHVQGTDLQTGSSLRGSLHLVDLAGSERIDRSEVTGDRLKEAQHINKSLSALGDVIFALAQKSAHVPYRNSKLTQVLQNSLGGQAKTLMFVQLNPRPDSYSETLSTLKFAERVSGVELGAARSNKEGKDVRELMEQVASLKDTITKKDEEIEHLQLLKDLRGTGSPASINREKRTGLSPLQNQSSSPRRNSLSGARGVAGGRGPGLGDKAASDQDNCSEYSDRNSEAGSHQSAEDISRQHAEERMSDASDGGVSVENEAEDLVGDLSISPADVLLADIDKSEEPSKVSQLIQKQEAKVNLLRSSSSSALARGVSSSSLSRVSSTKDSLKSPKSSKKLVPSSSATKPLKGWQQ